MIGYTSRPWAWTQSSRSTPTSPKHNLTFTSRFDKGISVESFTWWNTRWVWLMKTSEFTHIKEGIGSTRQGIMETYTTSFNSKCHQLESRAWLAKQMIQFTKGTMYQGKNSQGDWIWRTLSDSNPTMDRAIHNGVEVSIGIPERMHGHHIIEHRNNLMLR